MEIYGGRRRGKKIKSGIMTGIYHTVRVKYKDEIGMRLRRRLVLNRGNKIRRAVYQKD